MKQQKLRPTLCHERFVYCQQNISVSVLVRLTHFLLFKMIGLGADSICPLHIWDFEKLLSATLTISKKAPFI
jgi:hypothetical protein